MTYPATALLGHRLNAFRLNYVDAQLYINIGGSWTGGAADKAILVDSLSVNDRLNEIPNTLTATVRGTKPNEGATIRVVVGSKNSNLPLFVGTILRTTRVWAASNPKHVLYHVEATDPTWRLMATLVSARYRGQSASAIAADLLTKAPAGFVSGIEAGLPVLDEISFTNATIMDAFVQLAQRIGGYAWCDYDSRVYLASAVASTSPPQPLTAAHKSLAHVSYVRDLTQVVTRAVVEGGGGNALTNVPAGASTLPVDTAAWYSAGGGVVRSGPQRIAYAGLTNGGAGAYVGAGVTPTTAPTAAVGIGASGVENGTHQYAYAWVTAAGETLPSPLVGVTLGVGGVAAPAPAPIPGPRSNISGAANGLVPGTTYQYAFAWRFVTTAAAGPAGPLSAATPVLCSSWNDYNVPSPPVAKPTWAGVQYFTGAIPDGALHLGWYRQVAGTWYLVHRGTVADINASQWLDGVSDADILANPSIYPAHPAPLTGDQVAARVTLTGIAPGPAGVISRKVYRTAAGASQLKLHSTIANNTATTLPAVDTTPDASLGANAPGTDTAGLVAQSKLVLAGGTDIIVTSVGPFGAAGGYATVGNQVIKYGGVSATSLTGVPALGDGALLQSVAWGTPIAVAPALLGVSGIVWPIIKGDPVNLVALVDDVAAQTALAAAIGGDGVRESLLQDGRISLTEAQARGRALLAQQARVIETFAHRSRDPLTRSGATVSVNLPPPTDIVGSYRLQDVTISTFNARGLVMPTYDARSSSQRFTFEDLVRRLTNAATAPPTGEER